MTVALVSNSSCFHVDYVTIVGANDHGECSEDSNRCLASCNWFSRVDFADYVLHHASAMLQKFLYSGNIKQHANLVNLTCLKNKISYHRKFLSNW